MFGRVKTCPTCGGENDTSQSRCRPCRQAYDRRWHANRSEPQKTRRRELREARRQANYAVILEHLETHPCADCGETDVVVLEFDHVRGKKRLEVGRLANSASTQAVLDEIAKCDVVCANDHRRRTAKRAGNWYRSTTNGT